MPEAESTFPAAPASVSAAREFVTDTLEAWQAHGVIWAATSLVSELATNAVLHARSDYTVALRLDGDVLRVAVTDGSVRLPQRRMYDDDATTGRGLLLLATLSSGNGVEVSSSGKTVWCELPMTTGGAGEPSGERGPEQATDLPQTDRPRKRDGRNGGVKCLDRSSAMAA